MADERAGRPRVPDQPASTVTEVRAVPGALRAAVGVLLVEALALVAAAVILVAKTIAGTPRGTGEALLLAALALGGALVLALGARGLNRLNPSARSPIVVIQLLALPVSYSLAFQADRIAYGGPIMVAALAVLFLLCTPPVRDALYREPPR